MSEETQKTNKKTLMNSLCYLPFVSIILFFTESNKSKDLMKHIKYGTVFFGLYIVATALLSWMHISGILFLIYVWIAWFSWYKAYNWEEVHIEYVDKIESKIREKWNDVEKKDDIVDWDIEEVTNNPKK